MTAPFAPVLLRIVPLSFDYIGILVKQRHSRVFFFFSFSGSRVFNFLVVLFFILVSQLNWKNCNYVIYGIIFFERLISDVLNIIVCLSPCFDQLLIAQNSMH